MTGRIRYRKAINTQTGVFEEVPEYLLDGRRVTKEEWDEAFPPRPLGGEAACFFKPMESVALAVHPRRRQEAIDDAKAKGVPTEFTPDGCPVFRTRQHRRQYLRVYNFHDNNGGYGDG